MGIGMINIITACGLAKLLFDLPDHLVLVNEMSGFCREHDLELTEDIDQFNSVFWPVLFSLYDVKILYKDLAIDDDEQSIAFVIHNDVFGLQYNNIFYHL